MPEVTIPTEEEIEAVVKLAEHLPRITASGTTPEEIKNSSALFGNNFYMLFREMMRKKQGQGYPPVYLHKAEALGQPWQDFLSQNTDLLAKIESALAEYEIFTEIQHVLIQICVATRDKIQVDTFDKKFDPKLGINAIVIPIVRKLNPLLEQAANAMKKLGIEPTMLVG